MAMGLGSAAHSLDFSAYARQKTPKDHSYEQAQTCAVTELYGAYLVSKHPNMPDHEAIAAQYDQISKLWLSAAYALYKPPHKSRHHPKPISLDDYGHQIAFADLQNLENHIVSAQDIKPEAVGFFDTYCKQKSEHINDSAPTLTPRRRHHRR